MTYEPPITDYDHIVENCTCAFCVEIVIIKGTVDVDIIIATFVIIIFITSYIGGLLVFFHLA